MPNHNTAQQAHGKNSTRLNKYNIRFRDSTPRNEEWAQKRWVRISII